MLKDKEYFFNFFLILGLCLLGCSGKSGGKGSPTEPASGQDEPVLEITNVTSPETEIVIVVTDEDKEKVVVLGEKNEEGKVLKLTGGTYISPDNVPFTFWFGDDGLPSVAISGELVFRFTNYTNNTVDISLTTLDGTTVESLAIEIDAEKLRELREIWVSGKIIQEGISVAKAIRAVSAGLSLGCCAGNIALSLTGVGATVGVFGVAACCVGGILGTTAVLTDNDLLGTGALAISALTCAIGELGGCAKVGLAAIAKEVEEAEEKRVGAENLPPETEEGVAEIIGTFSP